MAMEKSLKMRNEKFVNYVNNKLLNMVNTYIEEGGSNRTIIYIDIDKNKINNNTYFVIEDWIFNRRIFKYLNDRDTIKINLNEIFNISKHNFELSQLLINMSISLMTDEKIDYITFDFYYSDEYTQKEGFNNILKIFLKD